MPLYRLVDAKAQVLEYRCVELTEEALYGRLTKQPKQPIPPEMTPSAETPPQPAAPGAPQ